jgi:hypothetical protein
MMRQSCTPTAGASATTTKASAPAAKAAEIAGCGPTSVATAMASTSRNCLSVPIARPQPGDRRPGKERQDGEPTLKAPAVIFARENGRHREGCRDDRDGGERRPDRDEVEVSGAHPVGERQIGRDPEGDVRQQAEEALGRSGGLGRPNKR